MKKVVIYSTPTCVYCNMAKNFFKENNIDYIEYDLATDAEKRDEMVKKTGQMSVPVIEVDGETMIGFNKEKLAQILGK